MTGGYTRGKRERTPPPVCIRVTEESARERERERERERVPICKSGPIQPPYVLRRGTTVERNEVTERRTSRPLQMYSTDSRIEERTLVCSSITNSKIIA